MRCVRLAEGGSVRGTGLAPAQVVPLPPPAAGLCGAGALCSVGRSIAKAEENKSPWCPPPRRGWVSRAVGRARGARAPSNGAARGKRRRQRRKSGFPGPAGNPRHCPARAGQAQPAQGPPWPAPSGRRCSGTPYGTRNPSGRDRSRLRCAGHAPSSGPGRAVASVGPAGTAAGSGRADATCGPRPKVRGREAGDRAPPCRARPGPAEH